MDFLQAGAKIDHLLKDELSHELSIRNFPVNSSARRSSLCQTLKQTASFVRRGSLMVTDLKPSEVSAEVDVCLRKVADIEKVIREDLSSSTSARLISRCRYISCRVSRLDGKLESVQQLKSRVDELLDRLKNTSELFVASESDDEEDSSASDEPVVKKIIYKPLSNFNINSLNLKFNGDTCVRTFLTRLEELRVARKIPEDRIFCGFPEILDGPALSWFRASRSTFTSYSDVVSAIKEEFDIPDLDHLLLNEIRSRTQSKHETIVTFLATVLGMCERLEKDLSDSEKLDILMRNIRPEYSKELALQDISSIAQLKSLCKRIELAKVRADQFREPSADGAKPSSSRTISNSKRNFNSYRPPPAPKNFVDAVNPSESKQPCFRCGRTNHYTRHCKASRALVCFKCGEKDVRTPECPKCNTGSKN